MGLLTLCFSTKTSTKTRHASSFITVAAIKAWVPNSGLTDWAAKYIKYKGPAANNKLNMKNGNILRAIFNF